VFVTVLLPAGKMKGKAIVATVLIFQAALKKLTDISAVMIMLMGDQI